MLIITPYLGLLISKDLKWANYVDKISKTASSTLGFVCQDSGISEELSVKTLANMFDFRLSDPSMSKNLQKLIRESKLDSNNKYSPPLDVNTCSEC